MSGEARFDLQGLPYMKTRFESGGDLDYRGLLILNE